MGGSLVSGMKQVMLMAVIFIVASAIGFAVRYSGFPDANTVVVYLLAVLLISWLTQSFIFGLLASVLATIAYNYFFTEPYYDFAINDPNYITTFVTMTVTALITNTLTLHTKQSERVALQREAETQAILTLTKSLTDAKDMHEIAGIAVSVISDCFSCKAACLCYDEAGIPENTYVQQVSDKKQIRREFSDAEGGEFDDRPITGSEAVLGIIRIPKEAAMTEAQASLLKAMIENIALAMDRFQAAEQRMRSREETTKERYRANLLRAISHDLRTPLSAIIGTSEMLRSMTEPDDPRYTLAGEIHKDADWLHSLVENILSLTRLQDGKLALKKQPEAVEEIIDGAVRHVSARSPERRITVSIPDELLLVPMDAKLIEQVFINLLDNAVVHTKSKGRISVLAETDGKLAKFTVRDEGTGIKKSDLPNIFQAFYTKRNRHADAGLGIGLGLAICETIVKAHGGSIEAHNRKDRKGAEFVFTLPARDEETANNG